MVQGRTKDPTNPLCPKCGLLSYKVGTQLTQKGKKPVYKCEDCGEFRLSYDKNKTENHSRYHPKCPKCGSRENHRKGFDKLKNRRKQRYQCQRCAKYFLVNYEKNPVNKLENEISILPTKMCISQDLLSFFPSKSISIFIDPKHKKIGLRDVGNIILRPYSGRNTTLIYKSLPALIRDYNVKSKRYPAKWSDKHQMVVAKIEFEK